MRALVYSDKIAVRFKLHVSAVIVLLAVWNF